MSNHRAMVFIDGQNLYHGACDYFESGNSEVDFVRLVEFLTQDDVFIRPYLFNSHPKDHRPHNWYHHLKMAGGFRVHSKPLRERDSGVEEKGVDINLATELIAQGFNDSYDVAVLVSGDSDFERAVRYVQNQGKIVRIAMFRNQTGNIKSVGDEYVPLDDHVSEFRDSRDDEDEADKGSIVDGDIEVMD